MSVWEPSDRDWQQVFVDQNPWWKTGKVPAALAPPVRRDLVSLLADRLQTDAPRRFQVILGPRRVGKTVAMHQTLAELLQRGVPRRSLWWLRIDHPLLLPHDLGSLVKTILANAATDELTYLFLDEITYAKDWDLWLKTFYDENWPVRIVATSSATAALKDRHLESGIGRWEEQYLPPCLLGDYFKLTDYQVSIDVKGSLAETLTHCGSIELDLDDVERRRRRFLLTGGFPELLLDSRIDSDEETATLRSQRTLRSEAVERAIYKDIPQTFGLGSPLLLERLLYTLAGQMTGILSPKVVCQTLDGMSQPTFDKYLTYLIGAFLVFVLPNYAGSEGAMQRRGRKLYFVDGAVRNAALQRGVRPLEDPAEYGTLLENLVASHLHALAQQTQTRLFHWRDGKAEIDLVYDDPKHPLAFEIAFNAGHARKGLRQFVEKFDRFRGNAYLVAPNAPFRLPTTAEDGIGSIPLDILLLAVSAQAGAALRNRLIP